MELSILLYGNFEHDQLGASYQRAFQILGHRVVPFDTREIKSYLAPWLRNRLTHRLTRRSLKLRQIGSQRWNQQLLQSARENKSDLLFILNGEFLMPETLQSLQQEGIRVFIFHPDNPFPPFVNTRPETLLCAQISDCYFIWSRALVERLKSIGVRRAEYLPFAWDPEVFSYAEPDGTFDHDIVFIGGWDKERESFLTPIAKHFDLKIWGPDYWGTRTRFSSPLRACWQGHTVRSQEAAHILRRSRIALNVLRDQNLPDGVIMRTFELPGCGAFALSTRTQGTIDIFPDKTQAAYFSNLEECIEQIKLYQYKDASRTQMIKEAHTEVYKNHRYTHRVQDIISTYQELLF